MELVGLASFFAGVLTAILGSAAADHFGRRSEHRKDLAQRRHRIYLMLLDVYHEHFWIATNDMHGTEIRPEWKQRFYEARLRIGDELRAADDLPQMADIIDALFSLRFKTETDRWEQIRKVIDDLGQYVSPRFLAAMQRRDREASALMMEDSDEWLKRRRKIEPYL